MPQSLSQVYLHSIFNTFKRRTLIHKNDLSELHHYIGGIAKNIGSHPIAIGGTENHVHLLSTFPRDITIAQFMQKLKGNSSRWIKKKPGYQDFAWQKGYAVLSVSSSKVDVVSNYINQQEEHHKKLSYQEELIQFLDEYNVDYDEKYLWD